MAERLTGDYRKYLDKNYLGAWDIPEDGDLILTIDHAERNEIQNERGKEKKSVLYFVEDYKPLILNKVNPESISKALGSAKFEDWEGKKIALYSEKVSAFGGTKDAVRIRPYPPKVTDVFCEDCGQLVTAHDGYSVNKIVTRSQALFGKNYCWDCSIKHKEAGEANG